MESAKIKITDFPAVSNTALMTVYCRARDYMSKNSILKDKFAYELYQKIECDWKTVKKGLHGHDFLLTSIRGRKFDQMCSEFLAQNPNGIIACLGAGLDYRFGRIDNGKCTVVEVEFPEVLDFKKRLIPDSPRNLLVGQSVLDYSWITKVHELSRSFDAPVFIIAEGLIPYLEKSEIKTLFQKIGENFPKSRIFFDVCGEKSVQLMSKHSGIEEWEVRLKSGFNSGKDFENMSVGFKWLNDWYFNEDPDAKKGMMKLMWLIPAFKSWLFFIHGQFSSNN
jgi:O-methyltransferase involved in polyketide biosynthesis